MVRGEDRCYEGTIEMAIRINENWDELKIIRQYFLNETDFFDFLECEEEEEE